MEIKLPKYNDEELGCFVREQWHRVIGYLETQYSLSRDESKDIFQDSFLILHEQNNSGKLDELRSSLSTYFMGICKNKAKEVCRYKRKKSMLDLGETLPIIESEFSEEKVNLLLGMFDNDEKELQEKKENLVRKIVQSLSFPCDSLLWGYFRDHLSPKYLANHYGYKNEHSLKVIKHRCLEKFHNKYKELHRTLFD